MKQKQKGNIVDWGLVFLVIVLGFLISSLLDLSACKSKWENSGMAIKWGPVMGCFVEVQPGKWIPADQYRELPK